MHKSLIIFLICGLCYAKTTSLVKKAFKTDYCTLFPEGTWSSPNLWRDCCIDHDLQYWMGGLKEDEKKADQQLRECVASKNKPIIASLMFYAVKFGKILPFIIKTEKDISFHWGWGRSPTERVYQRRTKKALIELENISKTLKSSSKQFYIQPATLPSMSLR